MNSEKLQLPDFVLADLFPHSLVEFPGDRPIATPAPELPWFLGGNRKRIIIWVNDETARHLRDEWLALLVSILDACKLNMEDVAIVNQHHLNMGYTALTEALSPGYLLLFGLDAAQTGLPFQLPHYQVQKYNQSQIILAPSLAALAGKGQEARLEKSKLWLSLKKMFGL